MSRGFGTAGIPRQIIDRPILLNEGSVTPPPIANRPTIVIQSYGQRKHRLRNWIQLDIVDTHPIASAVRVVIDTFERDNIVEARTDFGTDALQRERRRRIIGVQVFRVNDNLLLDELVIEINLDAVLRVKSIVI